MKQVTPDSYDHYRQIQVEANLRKFQNIWATPNEMDEVAKLIRSCVPNPRFGLCHGARNGQEVRLLQQRLGPEVHVLGTDISPSANNIPGMIQWDFHDIHPDWLGRADFLYSNSWDHTYDIRKLASAWAETLRPGGLAIIHWTRFHSEEGTNDGPDMFGCSEDAIAAFFANAGLIEQTRVRLPPFARRDLGEVVLEIGPDPAQLDQAPCRAHYVEHDGEVVLIPFLKPVGC